MFVTRPPPFANHYSRAVFCEIPLAISRHPPNDSGAWWFFFIMLEVSVVLLVKVFAVRGLGLPFKRDQFYSRRSASTREQPRVLACFRGRPLGRGRNREYVVSDAPSFSQEPRKVESSRHNATRNNQQKATP